MTTHKLVEHFFRHEYGRLVALLSRRGGVQHLETVEDAVQCALMTALESWTAAGLPDNPSAWLFRVAHNELMGEFRQHAIRRRLLERNTEEAGSKPENGPEQPLAGEVCEGPAAGLAVLEDFVPPSWLTASYLWAAVLADLHRRCGDAPPPNAIGMKHSNRLRLPP